MQKRRRQKAVFWGNEFLGSGKSRGENESFQAMMGRKELENKTDKKWIIDEYVYGDKHEKSITLSKTNFADLVANNDKFIKILILQKLN
jgi:hypothetical protein